MLSIIIPTLNEETYLLLLLKSIKKQSFKDYELIVSDAGSEDKTLETADAFGCKTIKGGLPAKGRNEGARIAKGDLLLFMDADNEIESDDFLKELLNEFKNRNLGIASFPIYPKGTKFDRTAYGIYYFWVRLTQGFLPHTTNSILVKKEIHEKIKGFDEKVKFAEDHEYARRAQKYGKFGFIDMKPVFTSARRFEKDGRLKVYIKYVLAEIYMIFFGSIKSDVFNYNFDKNLKRKRK